MSATSPSSTPSKRGRPGYDLPEILRVSVATFNEHGYDATSMSILGERLGLSKSAIYHHVPSKEELLRLALNVALDNLEAALESAISTQERSDLRLEAILRGAIRVLLDHSAEVTLLLRVRGNSDVEREALARRRAFDTAVTTILTTAAADGYLRADIAPRLATRLIFGMVNSIVEWYKPGTRGADDALTEAVLALTMTGLATGRTTSPTA